MTGVGILSGFGTPDNPPDYDLKKDKNSKIFGEDTHPGPGMEQFNGKIKEIDAANMLGEDD
ncbi:MAG: hypothetical protein ACOY46_20090 [Bacillota bacterium]